MGLHWALQWIPPRLLWVWGQAALPTAHLFHLEKKGVGQAGVRGKGRDCRPRAWSSQPTIDQLREVITDSGAVLPKTGSPGIQRLLK